MWQLSMGGICIFITWKWFNKTVKHIPHTCDVHYLTLSWGTSVSLPMFLIYLHTHCEQRSKTKKEYLLHKVQDRHVLTLHCH